MPKNDTNGTEEAMRGGNRLRSIGSRCFETGP